MYEDDFSEAELGDLLIFKPLDEISKMDKIDKGRRFSWWNSDGEMDYLSEEGIRVKINEKILENILNGTPELFSLKRRDGKYFETWAIVRHVVELQKNTNHTVLGEIMKPVF
jgi:hypothetical protein